MSISKYKIKAISRLISYIVCASIVGAMVFYCGKVNQQFRYHKENSNQLYSQMSHLRNELILMSSVIFRTDYDLSLSDKGNFGILTSGADVYSKLRRLISDTDNFEYYEDKLSYSRPSINFILDLTNRILFADFEEYPQLFSEALPFIESYSSEDLWTWLDNLDCKLQEPQKVEPASPTSLKQA